MRTTRLLVIVAMLVSAFAVSLARGNFFDMPVDGTLYASAAGGSAVGATSFGTGTSQSNFIALITGLPGSPAPAGRGRGGDILRRDVD